MLETWGKDKRVFRGNRKIEQSDWILNKRYTKIKIKEVVRGEGIEESGVSVDSRKGKPETTHFQIIKCFAFVKVTKCPKLRNE